MLIKLHTYIQHKNIEIFYNLQLIVSNIDSEMMGLFPILIAKLDDHFAINRRNHCKLSIV